MFLNRHLHPLTGLLSDDDAGAGSGAESAAAAPADAPATGAGAPPPEAAPAAAPAAAPETPPEAPWAKDIAAALAAADPAAALDEYMRTKQQPYITKLEQEKAELAGKAWVYDGLNEDPLGTLQEIAAQVWDEDTAGRIAELIDAGEAPEAAVEQAEAEKDAKVPEKGEVLPPELDLSKLPPEVREAVEFAQAEKARREQEAAQAANADALAEATKVYDAWRADVLKDNPDIVEDDLHMYVVGAEGDLDAALARYREVHPAPEVTKPKPSPTLTGGGSTGGIQPTRPASSLGEACGDVFDAAHKGHTTL